MGSVEIITNGGFSEIPTVQRQRELARTVWPNWSVGGASLTNIINDYEPDLIELNLFRLILLAESRTLHNKPLQTDKSAAEPVPASAAQPGRGPFGLIGRGRLVPPGDDRCTFGETF